MKMQSPSTTQQPSLSPPTSSWSQRTRNLEIYTFKQLSQHITGCCYYIYTHIQCGNNTICDIYVSKKCLCCWLKVASRLPLFIRRQQRGRSRLVCAARTLTDFTASWCYLILLLRWNGNRELLWSRVNILSWWYGDMARLRVYICAKGGFRCIYTNMYIVYMYAQSALSEVATYEWPLLFLGVEVCICAICVYYKL